VGTISHYTELYNITKMYAVSTEYVGEPLAAHGRWVENPSSRLYYQESKRELGRAETDSLAQVLVYTDEFVGG
jgi:hypothetical protein